MRELAKLPNTGTAIESQLEPVGISTPEALRSVGGRRSWQRPYSNHRFIRYYNRLCALKGTLRDIRAWYDLERPIEEALKSFIRTIKNHDWGGFYEYNTLCLCSNRRSERDRPLYRRIVRLRRVPFVAVIDMDREAGELLAQRFDGLVFYFPGDVAEKATLDRFATEVLKRFGAVDVLVNNACLSRKGILSNCSYDDFLYVQQVGVAAPYYLTNLFRDHFTPALCDKYRLHAGIYVPGRYRELHGSERGHFCTHPRPECQPCRTCAGQFD